MSESNAFRLAKFAAILMASVSGAAIAQETPVAEEGVNDIIVTAQKRAERLQDVPVSVSAIGGSALEKSRVTQADELVTKVPNLQLSSTVGDNTPIFSLRGVSMSDYSLNQASPVATYYDEVYKGNFALLGVAMFDLERVEVLRGPQGTLYGKNTTGGAVNLISRAPKLGETNGYVNLGYGNFNRVDVNAAVNVPLSDVLAVRVAGTFARADGWFKNQLPGGRDLGGVREYGIRGSILFEPADGTRFILRAAVTNQNPTNYGIFAQPEATLRAGLGEYEIESNVNSRRKARTYSVSLTGNIDVSDTLAITSVTAFDKGRIFFHEDSDGVGTQSLEVPYFGRAKQFAQDLRLSSSFDGPFNFLLGAYYHREKVFNETTFQIANDFDADGSGVVDDADCAAALPAACKVRNSFDQLKTSIAIYSDMTFELADRLTLRGGLRYTHDKGSQTNFESNALGVNEVLVANLIPLDSRRFTTDNVSGKIGIDYKLPDGDLLYASFSRGYRGSSFNAQAFFDPSELSVAKPEKVNAFEIGAKTQFLDRRVTLNMAAFYYLYKNQQFINLEPSTAAQTLLNIDKSRIMGAEAELTARATDGLTVRAGVGLLSTKIKDGLVSGNIVDGNRLSNAPKLTLNGGFDAKLFEVADGTISLSSDVSYASAQYFEVLNIPRLKQKGYALLSAHLDWESADGRWNASIWGKNLTQKFYFTSRIDLQAGFGYDYNHVGQPRTYGVTVGTKF